MNKNKILKILTGSLIISVILFSSLVSLYKDRNEIIFWLKNKNPFLLSSIVFIVVSLNPILPSGSFFTTFSATIFWINYAIMITFFDCKKHQLKN